MQTGIIVFFFRKKSLNGLRLILTFDHITGFFFQVHLISLVKRKAKSTIEHQKCKGYEKRDRLRKWSSFIRFLSKIKTLPTDPFFSN